MTDTIHTRMLILGSGPAGLSAAIYAARAGLKPVVVQGIQPGGQLTITTDVENYPGFRDVIQGPWLMEEMTAQAEHVGTTMVYDIIVDVDLSQRPFKLTGDGGTIYVADTLVIATGAQAKWLGLESETAMQGKGVSACATCDGFFYRGKKIMVIGGGDSAMEEANFLTRFGSEVNLVHRTETFRASKIMLDRARKHEKIEFLTDTIVEDVHDAGQKEVTALKLRNVKTGKVWDFPTSAMFLGIGHEPNAKMFEGQLDMDQDGYLKTHDFVMTRVPGVFASGDVQDRRYRQAITAAGSGCAAAIEAEKFLEEHGR